MLCEQKILFTNEECQNILKLEKTETTNWKKYKDRSYLSQNILLDDNNMWLYNKLKFFFEDTTKIELKKINEEIHFHEFLIGDSFNKHNDVRNRRIYAVGVLLNDNYEGGDFIIFNDKNIKINKITGNTYIFDVRLYHEITQITNGVRYSLIWFLHDTNLKIKNQNLI